MTRERASARASVTNAIDRSQNAAATWSFGCARPAPLTRNRPVNVAIEDSAQDPRQVVDRRAGDIDLVPVVEPVRLSESEPHDERGDDDRADAQIAGLEVRHESLDGRERDGESAGVGEDETATQASHTGAASGRRQSDAVGRFALRD